MSIAKRSLAWFRDSKMIMVALTASIFILSVSACSLPVENMMNSDGAAHQSSATVDTETEDPSVPQGPDAIYAQETDGYKEWDGTSEITAGMYVLDPTGEKSAKPASLFGHSAYFKDGAWYVFDPAKPLPQFVEDTYMVSKVDDSMRVADKNTGAIASDLEICQVTVMKANQSDYTAFGIEWVGIGGEYADGTVNLVMDMSEDGYFKVYRDFEAAGNGMIKAMHEQGILCKNTDYPITYGYSAR